ncbi:MAG TPA: HD domain-containing protein [Candidatus Limnocylindrales bacterium]|nr:HD domain-containing protein [Candidatus Limnocylindrales bacterium]
MAGLPVRRGRLTDRPAFTPPAPELPTGVKQLLDRLWHSGHAAYVVGGGLRDQLLGRPAADWDIATDARPERIVELFPQGRYENRFGTVTVDGIEATTFRRDHQYGDHRRPDAVTFTDDVISDLSRRDFTVNAIAWGRSGHETDDSLGPDWVDPSGGLVDLQRRLIRAVGEPARRFDEDALRLLRAARLSAQLGFEIEPATLAGMREAAHLVGHVSAERVGAELGKMLRSEAPSRGFALLEETGLLEPLFPELAAQVGLAQDKIPGHDLWQHSLLTLDAAAQLDPPNERLRLAALLHDLGKPTTYAEGRFIGHDIEGARMAAALLARLAWPRREIEPVVALIAGHMFSYERRWSDAAVRRFVHRTGRDLVADQLRLRQADNVGSGLPPDTGHVDELQARVNAVLREQPALSLAELAVNGRDLMAELQLGPSPLVGELLERLLEIVIERPERNTRPELLQTARQIVATRRQATGGAAP